MKNIFAILFLVLATSAVHAQDEADLSIEFATRDDYKKHEASVLRIADYLLSVPASNSDAEAKRASAVLVKWMTGTPDYKFELDATLSDFTKGNEHLLVPILAAMTSYVLHNADKASDKRAVKLNTYTIFLNYCENEASGVKLTKELRKAIAAKEKGTLDKYLKI